MTMPPRAPDWLPRLNAWLAAEHARRFDPVRAHCAHFVLGALEALTGVKPDEILAQLQIELPDTEEGVRALLAERGGMRGLGLALFGPDLRADGLNARRGDIAILDGDHGETLGVVEGGGVLCAASDTGLARFSLGEIKGYWSLP